MVKKAGESALERMASQTLNREFAWKPFMGDIKKLFQFQDKVQKRIELLNKFKEGPLLRKTELYSSVLSGPTSLGRSVISAAFGSCVADVMDYKTFRRYWGYVTYTPTPAMDNLLRDDAALRRKAINIVGGITVDASTIWQALPWSWLADWYGNLGDYLEAHRNLLPLTVSNPSICRTTRTVVTLRIRTPWVGKFYPYEHQFVWKERIPSSASLPSADLPLLTGRQIGILGSLAVLRGRGSSRL